MGVPGSNPGGPIIFRRKIEGCQSNTAGGERGLGQGWVCGGQYPGGPMSLTVGGRGHVEGGKTISRSAPSAFNLPPKPARSANGGWVREVRD